MDDFKTLVLGGASVKALYVIGALEYLNSKDKLKNIENYIGTSSGSIICLLLVLNITPLEIIIESCVNELFTSIDNLGFFNFLKKKGYISFDQIKEKLEFLIIKKMGYVPTLKELYNITKKNLIFITYNLTDECQVEVSHKNFPDLKVSDAAQMSSNIPLLFQEFKYRGKCYVDGFMSNNFPIDVAVNKFDGNIIGIEIISQKIFTKPFNQTSILEYVQNIFKILINNISLRNNLVDLANVKIITIYPETDISSTEFNIDNKQILNMFQSGYNQTKDLYEENKNSNRLFDDIVNRELSKIELQSITSGNNTTPFENIDISEDVDIIDEEYNSFIATLNKKDVSDTTNIHKMHKEKVIDYILKDNN